MPPKILEQTPRKSKKILTPHVARGMGLCVSLVNRCGHFIWPTVCFACRTAPCVLKYPKREHFSTYRAFWIVKKRGRRNPLILKSLVLVDWERIQDDKTRCKNAPCGENKQIKSRCESKSRTGADFFLLLWRQNLLAQTSRELATLSFSAFSGWLWVGQI